MKKRILVVMLLLPFFLFAKDGLSPYEFKKGHEFRIGYGVFPIDYNLMRYWSCDCNMYSDGYFMGEFLNNPSTYYGQMRNIGAFHFAYTYRFNKWFELSAVASASVIMQNKYYNFTNELAQVNNGYVISIAPVARFVWYRNSLVSLYSSVSFGLSFVNEVYFPLPSFNFNYFGVSVGKNIYWFADLSAGNMGVFSTGVGFRLKDKLQNTKTESIVAELQNL